MIGPKGKMGLELRKGKSDIQCFAGSPCAMLYWVPYGRLQDLPGYLLSERVRLLVDGKFICIIYYNSEVMEDGQFGLVYGGFDDLFHNKKMQVFARTESTRGFISNILNNISLLGAENEKNLEKNLEASGCMTLCVEYFCKWDKKIEKMEALAGVVRQLSDLLKLLAPDREDNGCKGKYGNKLLLLSYGVGKKWVRKERKFVELTNSPDYKDNDKEDEVEDVRLPSLAKSQNKEGEKKRGKELEVCDDKQTLPSGRRLKFKITPVSDFWLDRRKDERNTKGGSEATGTNQSFPDIFSAQKQ